MYKQRDILIIPIPFTDLSSKKRRPVLVISNDRYNRKTEDIIVTAITSNIKQKDYTVFIGSKDLQKGILQHDSMIRVDNIYTLNKSIVVKKFGVLKKDTFAKVKDTLQKLI
jgi:mRNA interferase MazF